MRYLLTFFCLFGIIGCTLSHTENLIKTPTTPVSKGNTPTKIDTTVLPLTETGVKDIVDSGAVTRFFSASGEQIEVIPMSPQQLEQVKNNQ